MGSGLKMSGGGEKVLMEGLMSVWVMGWLGVKKKDWLDGKKGIYFTEFG